MAVNEFHTSLNVENDIYWGTAVPSAGTFKRGDFMFNTAPSAGGVLGWSCVTAGTPGTWKGVAPVDGPYTLGTLNATLATIQGGVATLTSGVINTATIPAGVATLTGGIATLTSGVITTATLTGYTSTNGTITTGTVTNLVGTNSTITSLYNGVTVVTLAAAAALTNKAALQLITLAAGNTMTLAPAASHVAGFEMTIKNLANNSVTIATVAGATYADAAAITLAQNASVTIVGDGTTWYKKD